MKRDFPRNLRRFSNSTRLHYFRPSLTSVIPCQSYLISVGCVGLGWILHELRSSWIHFLPLLALLNSVLFLVPSEVCDDQLTQLEEPRLTNSSRVQQKCGGCGRAIGALRLRLFRALRSLAAHLVRMTSFTSCCCCTSIKTMIADGLA